MPSTDERAIARAERGFERFLLFTDAVVAIAITLLILPVVDRASEAHDTSPSVWDLISDMQSQLYGFLLSFLVIGVLWRAHRRLFESVAYGDTSLFWLGLGWLLTIVVLPFTTALIPHHGDEQGTALIYIANVAISSALLSASSVVVARNPHLQTSDSEVDRTYVSAMWMNTIMLGVAFVLALLFEPLRFSALFILFLQNPIGRFASRRRARAA